MRRTLAGLVAVGVIAVGGCSGDDDEGGSDEPAEETGTTAAEGEAASGAGSGRGALADGEAADFCAEFIDFNEEFLTRPEGPTDEEVLEALQALTPPDAIAGDLAVLVAANEARVADQEIEDTGEAEAATANVQTYIEETCDYELGGEPEGQTGETASDPTTPTTAPE